MQGAVLFRTMTLNPPIIPPGVQYLGMYGQFMGFSIPLGIVELIAFLNVAMLVWGCYVLTKPSVRRFFRPINAS
jgi:hypothetical protein